MQVQVQLKQKNKKKVKSIICAYKWRGVSSMKLYRPVGVRELELIKQSGMTQFPPRLPEQPIFYPVLNKEYACQIAREWNARSAPYYAGFVTEFEIDDEYISKFEVKTVGAFIHKELWVPAEELDEFNKHIIGKIKVIECYYGDNYKGSKAELDNIESDCEQL